MIIGFLDSKQITEAILTSPDLVVISLFNSLNFSDRPTELK